MAIVDLGGLHRAIPWMGQRAQRRKNFHLRYDLVRCKEDLCQLGRNRQIGNCTRVIIFKFYFN